MLLSRRDGTDEQHIVASTEALRVALDVLVQAEVRFRLAARDHALNGRYRAAYVAAVHDAYVNLASARQALKNLLGIEEDDELEEEEQEEKPRRPLIRRRMPPPGEGGTNP